MPTSPAAEQAQSNAQLQSLSGMTFDRSYVNAMIEDHEEDIREFQAEAASGQDSDAKAYASATLPTLRVAAAGCRVVHGTPPVDRPYRTQ